MKFQGNSPTSMEAAIFVEGFSSSARERVLLHILRTGGATDEECQHHLGMNPNTQRPRRVELVEADLIEDSGVTRPTASNMQAVVWVSTGKPYFPEEFLRRSQVNSHKKLLVNEVLNSARRYAHRSDAINRARLLVAAKQLKDME